MSTFPDPATYRFPEWVEIGDWLYLSRDVVAFGLPLTLENLREAYPKGIFPWHMPGVPLPWYCPDPRAVLEFSDLSVARSLEKERRKQAFTFTIDKDFRCVIEACSKAPRSGQQGTWITRQFIDVYTQLNENGMAHSVEAWNADGELVGGLYGVDAGGVFCGESMFHTASNASKLALLHLIDHLKQRGATWLDVQVMTPHMEALGAREIPRAAFLRKLKQTQSSGLKIF
jgi:leucyl/phenylalanyl-tRNA---protein transferase